jgi:amino acid transporter/nucleotide-binding universal stress UspA family protein
LYGDWGTSRFYVLGLAFFYSLYQSFWYVLAVGVLVALVGWAYTIICRCFPDGGGVYSSAKHLSRQLAVIGALLLCADYIVTAAMSAYDGIQYIGVPNDGPLVPMCGIAAIVLIGFLNYFGLRKMGVLALIVAMATFLLTLVITAFSVPHLAAGWHRIMTHGQITGHFTDKWFAFVNVVLALSGVEAVANMTGVMVRPVKQTARKTILPVLVEVVVLNLVLAIGMCALSPNPAKPAEKFTTPAVILHHQVHEFMHNHPDWKSHPQMIGQVKRMDRNYNRENEIQNEVLRVMASDFVGRPFGWICGIVFGLLLISAVNTAIGAMMSIQYTMSRDNELPRFLSRLNMFGVPWLALIPAVIVPVLILSIFHDLSTLGDLYAIGVVGAITINLCSAAINRELKLQHWERFYLAAVGVIMAAIELTLALQKHEALIFALSILASGLLARFYTKQYPGLSLKARSRVLIGSTALAVAISLFMLRLAMIFLRHHPVYAGWLFAASAIFLVLAGSAVYQLRMLVPQLKASAAATELAPSDMDQLAFGTPGKELDMSMPKVLVATRGSPRLLEFAAQYAKQSGAILFVLFVRQLNLAFAADSEGPTLEEDPDAINTFRKAQEVCTKAEVPLVPIYAVSPDVSYTILDFAATYSVNALLMGVSRRGTMLRALHGDTLTAVADQLPQDIPLLIHA